MVQATCRFISVVLCFPEYSSLCPSHDQHGSSVASGCTGPVKVFSGRHKFARRFRNERRYGSYGATDSRLGYAERLAYSACRRLRRM